MFGLVLGQHSGRGPTFVRCWVGGGGEGVPCLLGGYPLCVGSVLVHRLRWDLHFCVIMLLFGCLVQYIFYNYLFFSVTYKPKWPGLYSVNIFILLL